MKQVQIVMPQMGQSVAEGTIVAWKKSVGDEVEADEVVVEVETDKTTVDVESPAKGRLAACLKRDGEIAAAGEAIGVLETEGEDDPPLVAATNTPHAGAEKPSEPLLVSRGVSAAIDGGNGLLPEIDQDRFSPYVLRMALLNNVSLPELKSIRGSGRNGRLTKNDLLQYLGRRPVAAPVVAAPTDRDAAGPDALSPAGEVVPMSSLRRTIADHMVQSIHTSAHVTMVHAVDMTHVVNLRERIKDGFQKKYNAKMTYTAVLLFVTSRVLSQYPKINASVQGTNIILRKDINIGCAVALSDESLVVPVVKHADKKSFPEVAQELGALIERARDKSLCRPDVEGGTFTISNFGAFGSLIGTPIISQPQVAILGMGAVFKSPVVTQDNQIAVRDLLYLSFSFDHRIIDGALGGRFLNAIQLATEALTEESLSLEF